MRADLTRRNQDFPGDGMDFLKPYTAQLLSLLRIMSGLLVLQHGTTKYLNFPAGPMNNASPMTMSGAAGPWSSSCAACSSSSACSPVQPHSCCPA